MNKAVEEAKTELQGIINLIDLTKKAQEEEVNWLKDVKEAYEDELKQLEEKNFTDTVSEDEVWEFLDSIHADVCVDFEDKLNMVASTGFGEGKKMNPFAKIVVYITYILVTLLGIGIAGIIFNFFSNL